MFENSRDSLRRQLVEAWQKQQDNQVCTPLEKEIIEVLHMHPEYHAYITLDNIDSDYPVEQGEVNPFLHLSLHLGLREQLSTNRPKSITGLFQKSLAKVANRHDCEHLFIEPLAECMWEMQSRQQALTDEEYLKRIKKHLRKNNIRF